MWCAKAVQVSRPFELFVRLMKCCTPSAHNPKLLFLKDTYNAVRLFSNFVLDSLDFRATVVGKVWLQIVLILTAAVPT